jgi:hypothetical protein
MNYNLHTLLEQPRAQTTYTLSTIIELEIKIDIILQSMYSINFFSQPNLLYVA